MKIVSLKKQAEILHKAFGITISVDSSQSLIKDTDGVFVIPKWNKIGKTYEESLIKVFAEIKKTRPFYNWREGKLGSEHLRELPDKNVPEILSVQLGKKWKGTSVENVRKNKADNEILLGAYKVAIIILTHPDVVKSYDDLFIDCAGDEYSYNADGEFSSVPYFYWHDGKLYFGAYYVDCVNAFFGAASGFLSIETKVVKVQSNNVVIKDCIGEIQKQLEIIKNIV